MTQSTINTTENQMRNSLKLMLITLMIVVAGASTFPVRPAFAQIDPQRPQTQATEGRSQDARPAPTEMPKEETSVTDHTIQIGGQTIPYKASAGTILLKNDAGEPTGLMYSVAYTRSDVKDMSTRPSSFMYNGGSGTASMWLHMGVFGPRRVWTVNGEFTPPAPYKLVDN